mmetsp:Transcript_8383/g.37079  ORF Transcript_8383/g.37079 Transcript_8383/m.37079 type:complete len:396 (-) Transcript_8383:154-1341(-)
MFDAIWSALIRIGTVGHGWKGSVICKFSCESGSTFNLRSRSAAFSAFARSTDTSSALSAAAIRSAQIFTATCARLSCSSATCAQHASWHHTTRAICASRSFRVISGVSGGATPDFEYGSGHVGGGFTGSPASFVGQSGQSHTKPYLSSSSARRWLDQSDASTYACVSSVPSRTSVTHRNSWIHVGYAVASTSSRYEHAHTGAHEWFSNAPNGYVAPAIGVGSPPRHCWMKKSFMRDLTTSFLIVSSVAEAGMRPHRRAPAVASAAKSPQYSRHGNPSSAHRAIVSALSAAVGTRYGRWSSEGSSSSGCALPQLRCSAENWTNPFSLMASSGSSAKYRRMAAHSTACPPSMAPSMHRWEQNHTMSHALQRILSLTRSSSSFRKHPAQRSPIGTGSP